MSSHLEILEATGTVTSRMAACADRELVRCWRALVADAIIEGNAGEAICALTIVHDRLIARNAATELSEAGWRAAGHARTVSLAIQIVTEHMGPMPLTTYALASWRRAVSAITKDVPADAVADALGTNKITIISDRAVERRACEERRRAIAAMRAELEARHEGVTDHTRR